jgi:hypothetical protein
MAQWLQNIWQDDQGQDVAEYAVMLAVILVPTPTTFSRRSAARFSRLEPRVGPQPPTGFRFRVPLFLSLTPQRYQVFSRRIIRAAIEISVVPPLKYVWAASTSKLCMGEVFLGK